MILYVGTIEPRKNLPTLIEAFADRHRAGELKHQLVCVGPYGWLSRGIEDRIARSNAAHAITFTGYVPFEDLPALYSLAEMFVYPSMYEGFGLPVVEAMACGAPVLTGRTPALAEVGGGAIEHVDQIEPKARKALVDMAANRDRRAGCRRAGARSASFLGPCRARESRDLSAARGGRGARARRSRCPAARVPAIRTSAAPPRPTCSSAGVLLRSIQAMGARQPTRAGALCAAFVREAAIGGAFDASCGVGGQWKAALDETGRVRRV